MRCSLSTFPLLITLSGLSKKLSSLSAKTLVTPKVTSFDRILRSPSLCALVSGFNYNLSYIDKISNFRTLFQLQLSGKYRTGATPWTMPNISTIFNWHHRLNKTTASHQNLTLLEVHAQAAFLRVSMTLCQKTGNFSVHRSSFETVRLKPPPPEYGAWLLKRFGFSIQSCYYTTRDNWDWEPASNKLR